MSDKFEWFLAQVKPHRLKQAIENLERQNIKTFCPQLRKTKRIRRNFVEVTEPLFPGYIFISFDLNFIRWKAVNYTTGISKIVSFGNSPAKVPRGIILNLLEKSLGDKNNLYFSNKKKGALVEITEGPFVNFYATIEKIDSSKRVWVLLDFMGGEKRISIDPDNFI